MKKNKSKDVNVTVVNPLKGFNAYETWLSVGTPSFDPIGKKINPSDLIIAKSLREMGFNVTYIDGENNDLEFDEITERIDSSKPDFIIANTESYTNYRYPHPSYNPIQKQIPAALIRKTGAKLIIYGSRPIVEEPPTYVNYTCAGEGESTVPAMVQALVDGYSVKRYQNARIEPDINKFPIPAYDLVESPNVKIRIAYLVGSRGCQNLCSTCFNDTSGSKIRTRSNDSITTEIEALKGRGYTFFVFMDDCFGVDPTSAKELINVMATMEVKWSCKTIPGFLTLKGIPALLKESGCTRLKLQVESYNDKLLEPHGNNITVAQIDKSLEVARKANLNIIPRIILGMPGETRETFRRTERFIEGNDFDGVVSFISTPYPRTLVGSQNRIYKVISAMERAGTIRTWLKNEVVVRQMWRRFDEMYNKPSMLQLMKKYKSGVYRVWREGQDKLEK